MTWFDKMSGKIPDPNATVEDVHPVLTAALEAGVDTPEKFAHVLARADIAHIQPGQITALTTENSALKAECDRLKTVLAAQSVDVRAAAKKNAAIAYATDDTARLHALEDIDATAEGPALGRIAARMEAAAKAAVPDSGAPRQTSGLETPDVVRQAAQDAKAALTAEQRAGKKTELLALAGVTQK